MISWASPRKGGTGWAYSTAETPVGVGTDTATAHRDFDPLASNRWHETDGAQVLRPPHLAIAEEPFASAGQS